MNSHRLAEERSLAYHRVVAARLAREPRLVEEARERLGRWLQSGTRAGRALSRWQTILQQPIEAIAALLVDEGEEARELRQSSPFAGALSPRERWRIWREVRARFDHVGHVEEAE
jgi:hypothetical protein